MKAPDPELDPTHESPGEAAMLDALKAWGAAPVEAPDADASRETRRAVVSSMASVLRDAHVKRRARTRRTVALLVAVAAVLALGSTALAFVAVQRSGARPFEKSRSGLAPAVSMLLERSTAPSAASSASVAATETDAPKTDAPKTVDSAATVPQSDKPQMAHHNRPGPPTAVPSVQAAPPTASELAEQNRLFLAAMSARRRGDDAETVRACDALLTRYPHSPLAPDARTERANAAARLAKAPPP